MNITRKIINVLFLLFIVFPFTGFSQEIDENGYNYNSVRPIRRADIMYSKTVWLRMDLQEKQNEPFFAANNEIPKVIIDAVKAGVLRPYKNDSLSQRMSIQTFLDNLKLPGVGDDGGGELGGFGGDEDFGGGDSWGGGGDSWGGDDSASDSGGAEDVGSDEFFPKQINLLEFKEDILFDKKRSRMFHDIQSIKLIIPADLFPSGIEKELATFSYKELVENVFVDNPSALWYNPKNTGENRNLSDAFDLRLFSARVVKYSNPKDNMIDDIYNGNQKLSLAKSQEYEHWMLEYESNLWSN